MPSVVSIATGRRPHHQHQGEYLIVELALPGGPQRNIGVLLRDAESGQVYPKIRNHWEEIEDPEEAEWLEALGEDFDGQDSWRWAATAFCGIWRIRYPMRCD